MADIYDPREYDPPVSSVSALDRAEDAIAFEVNCKPGKIVIDVVCCHCHKKFRWKIAEFSRRTDITVTEEEYYRNAKAEYSCDPCSGSSSDTPDSEIEAE